VRTLRLIGVCVHFVVCRGSKVLVTFPTFCSCSQLSVYRSHMEENGVQDEVGIVMEVRDEGGNLAERIF
jgi:hypothetical protein